MLVMSQATLESLREIRARLYSDYRLSHVWANVKRAPNSSAARIAELGGVNAVEARLRAAGKLRLPDFGDSIEAAVLSASEAGESGQNRLYLRSGRLLDAQADDVAKLRAPLVRSSHARLEALAARFPGVETVVHVCDGAEDVQAQLAGLARRVDASALVVGAHRRSALGHLVLGSTTERCLRRCTRPVLVVPE